MTELHEVELLTVKRWTTSEVGVVMLHLETMESPQAFRLLRKLYEYVANRIRFEEGIDSEMPTLLLSVQDDITLARLTAG